MSDQLAGGIGGAESIVFNVLDIYPEADLFTTVYDKKIIPEPYCKKDIKASFVQKMPLAKRFYKAYFPLMPFAIEFLNFQDYDVIFSSHHSVAKGVIPRPDAAHICYCHSPARYIWDMFWVYSDLNRFNLFQRLFICLISNYLRMWDVTSACRVDLFLANSSYTATRIKKYYNRDARILHPPVDTEKFNHQESEEFYLMAGRLVAYKGFEMAVDAFNESGKRLIIAGDGAEYQKLKSKAKNNIELLGRVSENRLISLFNRCKGFIFPGKEDFGIVMAEAGAAGKPVIAFKGGGALDIIEDNKTGILFENQDIQSLNKAINLAESISWDHKYISNAVKRFDKKVFNSHIKEIIDNADTLIR